MNFELDGYVFTLRYTVVQDCLPMIEIGVNGVFGNGVDSPLGVGALIDPESPESFNYTVGNAFAEAVREFHDGDELDISADLEKTLADLVRDVSADLIKEHGAPDYAEEILYR